MKQILLTLVTALAVVGCSAQPAQESVYEKNLRSTVFIKAGDSSGAGVTIQRGDRYFIWTCAHVVVSRGFFGESLGIPVESVSVETWAYDKNLSMRLETVAEASVIFFLPESDLALLRVDTPGMAYLGVSFDLVRPARLGDKVFTIGHPFRASLVNSLTVGVISGMGRKDDPDNPAVVTDQLDIEINPGNSGGGVFYNDSGKVAGIAHAMLTNTSIGFMIPTRALYIEAKNFGFGWAVEDDGVVPTNFR